MHEVSLREAPTLVFSDGQDPMLRYREAVARIEADPELVSAKEALGKAEAYRERLQDAHARINTRSAELRESLRGADQLVRKTLVEDGSLKAVSQAIKTRLYATEELRAAIDTIAWLVEDALPEANIEVTRSQAELYIARAQALEATGNVLAEHMGATLAEAVGMMGTVQVDMSKGLAGALVSDAKQQRYSWDAARKQLREQEERLSDRRQRAMVSK